MTPEDKEFARTCLDRGWLTIEQVEEIKRVVEGRKVPFREVAVAYGVVREKPPPEPRLMPVLLLVTLGVFVLVSMVTLVLALREMHARALERARERAQLERDQARSRTAVEGDTTALAIEAERRLRHAREALRYVEDNLRTLQETERLQRLQEAVAGFDAFIEFRADSAAAHCDRARARDLLGRLPDALADYEKAMQLDPALVKVVAPRAAELRKILGK